MKLAYVLLLVFVSIASLQSDDTRYSYDVSGTVRDFDGSKMENIYVCIVPSKRPINGRIPCVKTSSNGSYAITVKDTPDEYKVCASTKESPLILLPNKDPSHRVVCSENITFPPHDDRKHVDLKFRRQNQ
ncbi:MAG TPA: hypothetical protein VIX17_26730 [Pyrinomonadaceae bacterium]